MLKVGDVIEIKQGITKSSSYHGDYEAGDIGIITDIYGDTLKVDFYENSKEREIPRENYSVHIEEVELSKVYKTKLWKELRG